MNEQIDAQLKTLLVDADRGVDEPFAARMRKLVAIEERLRADRRARWMRFAVEMMATSVVLAAFLLMATVRSEAGDVIPLFSPAGAGLLLLAIWVAVSTRAGAAPISH
jgi:hypothetical protein